jgi:UDP-glucose 4-epimerase
MSLDVSPPVLVTGGAGYVGSHMVLALQEQGRRVLVLDDYSTGTHRIDLPGVETVQGRAGDAALVHRLVASRSVDTVMHFAASISVEESIGAPATYYRNNVAETVALAEAAVRGGARRCIFSSTAAVYGEGTGQPLSEDDAPRPINPYGRSKAMAEAALQDIGAATGLAVGILRYFNAAGADPAARSGQATRHPHHLIELATQVATSQRRSLSIFGTDYPTPDGTAIRDYVHVADIASAHLAVADLLEAEGGVHRFNIGSGDGASVRQVVDALGDVIGQPIAATPAPRRAGDPAVLVADATRIRARTGWRPRHSDLHTILIHALAWERQRSARALAAAA